jgi:hypothetical protein
MALQKTTLALLGLALLLGGGALIYERTRGTAPTGPQAAATADSQPLFSFKEADVQAFTITSPEQTLSFERTGQPGNAWQMKSPKVGPASDASVAFLLNLLATGTSQKRLDVDTAQLAQFGLAPAKITVMVTLKNQQQHRLTIGSPIFDQSGIYGQIDAPPTPPAKVQVQVLPLNILNAVSRPLSEWEPSATAPAPAPSLLVPTAPTDPAAPSLTPSAPAPTAPPAQESVPVTAPTAPTPPPATPLPVPSPTQS